LGNQAHSAYRRVRLYSHNEPRPTVLRSEGKEGLLDGDPGEEEATNNDNSVVALHPDILELLQLSHSAQILSKSQGSPIRTRPTAQLRGTAHPRPHSNPRNHLRLARGHPAKASSNALITASLEGRRPTLEPSPPRGLGSRGNSASLEATLGSWN